MTSQNDEENRQATESFLDYIQRILNADGTTARLKPDAAEAVPNAEKAVPPLNAELLECEYFNRFVETRLDMLSRDLKRASALLKVSKERN